jgi:hypothetical protein
LTKASLLELANLSCNSEQQNHTTVRIFDNDSWDLICATTKDQSGLKPRLALPTSRLPHFPNHTNAKNPQADCLRYLVPSPYRSAKQQRICHRYFWFTLAWAYGMALFAALTAPKRPILPNNWPKPALLPSARQRVRAQWCSAKRPIAP